MALGYYMALTVDFTYVAVHAKLNVIGWVSMSLFAFYYNAVPAAAEEKLAKIHFWVAQIGLISMAPGLIGVLEGDMVWDIALGLGQVLTTISMGIFGYTVWRNPAK